MKDFISVTNPTGAEPVPKAALLNDTQNLTTLVEPGKTYMFRVINMGALAAQYLWFEGHNMRIVEVDGIYTEAAEANMIYLTAAQRYSVLITTKNDTMSNFAYVASMDEVNMLALQHRTISADEVRRISLTKSHLISTQTSPAGWSTTTPPINPFLPLSTHSSPSMTSPSYLQTENDY